MGKDIGDIYDDYPNGIGEYPAGDVPGERLIPHSRLGGEDAETIAERLQRAGKDVKIRWTVAGFLLTITAVAAEEVFRRGRHRHSESQPRSRRKRT